MNDIEQLLRDSLRNVPTPVPITPDPVPLIGRRVRRARWMLGAGGLAAAVLLTAGIAVPLALRTEGAAQVRIGPATHAPNPMPSSLGVGSLMTFVARAADWVSTSDDGHVWYSSITAASRDLVELNAEGDPLHHSPIAPPGSLVVAGADVVWVVGSDEGGSVLSRVAAYAPSGELLGSVDYPKDTLGVATQVNGDLYVVRSNNSGTFVDRVAGVGGRLVTASVSVPGAETVTATSAGHVWVGTSKKTLVQIVDNGTRLRVSSTVSWSGPILGTVAGGRDADALWSYDGSRVVELSPALLPQGTSIAEGARIPVPRTPSWVVSTTGRDVFVAINVEPVEIYYFRGDQPGTGGANAVVEVAGGQVNVMTADPAGGVDVVNNSGQLLRWNPRH